MIWNTSTLQASFDDANELNKVTSVKWNAEGKYIAVGTLDGTIRVSIVRTLGYCILFNFHLSVVRPRETRQQSVQGAAQDDGSASEQSDCAVVELCRSLRR